MTQTLIFIESYFTTNFSDSPQYDEQVIDNNEKSLEEYCDNLPKLLEQFKNSTNFEEEISKIPSQLEDNNFAQVLFKKALVDYLVTIIAPKFK